MKNKYISIQTFADKLNITLQDAFKLLKEDKYKGMYFLKNGKTYVYISALEYKPKEEEQKTQEEKTQDTEIIYLREEIKYLREQIKEKDAIIKDYTERFAKLAQNAHEIADKALTTAGQAQVLQAQQTLLESNTKRGLFKKLFSKRKEEK